LGGGKRDSGRISLFLDGGKKEKKGGGETVAIPLQTSGSEEKGKEGGSESYGADAEGGGKELLQGQGSRWLAKKVG